MTDENCGSCRFWRRHPAGELGDCRRRRPMIVESMAAANMTPQGDIERDDMGFATMFPATFIDLWCGEYELSDAVRFLRTSAAAAEDRQAILDRDYARALAPPADDNDGPW